MEINKFVKRYDDMIDHNLCDKIINSTNFKEFEVAGVGDNEKNKKIRNCYTKNISKEFDDDFQFLLVDVNEKRDKVKEHVSKKNITLQVVLDKYGKTYEKFGGKTLPLLVVINKKGVITYHHTGYKKGDEIKLKEHLNTL